MRCSRSVKEGGDRSLPELPYRERFESGDDAEDKGGQASGERIFAVTNVVLDNPMPLGFAVLPASTPWSLYTCIIATPTRCAMASLIVMLFASA